MIVPCSECGQRNRMPAAKLAAAPRCGKCKKSLAPFRSPVSVDSEQDFDALLGASPHPVLVDFWAAWCGPCRVVAPELEKLAQARAGEVVIAKVDADELTQVAGRFSLTGIPTMILFREGAEAARVAGAMQAEAIELRLGL